MNTEHKSVTIEDPKLLKVKDVIGQPKDRKIVVIYNPYTRAILVHFVEFKYTVEAGFEDECEWLYVDHPAYSDQYLAIQLDYDEVAQLIVYFENTEQGEYADCVSWFSTQRKSAEILIVHSDLEWQMAEAILPQVSYYPSGHIKFKKD